MRINALLQLKHSFFQFRKACRNTTAKQLGQNRRIERGRLLKEVKGV
ncbi:hypothetical protein H7U18_26805 [Klebsiella pneumoniae]|uniref:Uncharacterized protein n=1 Tax=Klebsiella pneumoniae TaxID=573 RepID=A0A923ESE3_KLEPN|nr:hypothetical protein [Klebsiella pneumoniae]